MPTAEPVVEIRLKWRCDATPSPSSRAVVALAHREQSVPLCDRRSNAASTHAGFSSHTHPKGTRSYNAVGQIACSRHFCLFARAESMCTMPIERATALRCASLSMHGRAIPWWKCIATRSGLARRTTLWDLTSQNEHLCSLHAIDVTCAKSALRSPTASGANVFRASCAVRAFVDRCVRARGMPLALSSGNRTQRYIA
jgi:hypothetical protein